MRSGVLLRASALHEVRSAEFRRFVGADKAEQLERLGAAVIGCVPFLSGTT